jgi:DNA-binding transcriptional MerR regulator
MADFICETPTDDSDVLRAVLAFLEEEGVFAEGADEERLVRSDSGSNAGGSSGSDAETSVELPSPVASGKSKRSSSSRKKSAGPRVFNRSRLRRRHEVLSLREQVVALEERLEALQKGEEASKDDDTENLKQVRVSAWQGIATYQREQLTTAEQEREKLRQLIKEYKLAVKRVERFLTKQTFPTGLLDTDATLVPLRVISDPDTGDGFDEISRNLPAMYQQINGVFSDPRFQTSVEGVQDMRLQNEDSIHMSVEVLDSRLLPFSVETTAQAVWHFHQIKSKKVATTLDEVQYMRPCCVSM